MGGGMELRHLRYFVAVAEESSFRRAAERLHVSQPALSRQVRDLEDELGARLLDRGGAAVRLTRAGEYFLKEARGIIEHSAEAAVGVRRFAEADNRTLNVGYITPALGGFLATSLQVFNQKHPQVRVNLFELSPAAQIAALRSSCLDIALVGHACPSLADEFKLTAIQELPLCVVLPETHPLALARSVELKQLATEPFVGLSEETFPGRDEILVELCAKAGFAPRVAQRVDGLATLLAVVGSGAGVAVVPAGADDLPHAHALLKPLRGASARVLFQAASRKADHRPLVATILEEFRFQAAARSGSSKPGE
jgi:LysR family transcriptional regulator, benzoate and cis,cis-muconate-responsive activator of ben and cat genes